MKLAKEEKIRRAANVIFERIDRYTDTPNNRNYKSVFRAFDKFKKLFDSEEEASEYWNYISGWADTSISIVQN